MSDDDKKIPRGSDLARKVWLAGLGAYGKAINNSQGAAIKLGAEANKVFEELVSRGEKLEESVEGAVELTRENTRQARADVEDRINKLKGQFGLVSQAEDDRIDAMEDRMERLEGKIDALLVALDNKPARKPAARKSTAPKPAARKTTTRKKKSD